MKLLRAPTIVAAALALSCAGLHVGGAGSTRAVSILYTGDLDWTRLPELSTLIKATEPALAIVTGSVLDGGKVTEAFRGQAEIEALARSGVNAICLSPDLLRYGLANTRRLTDSIAPALFFLGANVSDSASGQSPGQAYIKIGRPGGDGRQLVVIGLLTGSDPRQPGILVRPPDEAIRRLTPQLKMNADLIGAALCPSAELRLSGFDFVIGSKSFGTVIPKTARRDRAYRLDLQLNRQNQVAGHHVTEIDLTNVEPDPGVEAIVKNWQLRTESQK